MAANGTTTRTTQRKSAPRTTKTQTQSTSRTDAQKIREGLTKVRNGSVSYARQTAERSLDVPVGVALTVADRVNEVVEPFTKRETAERELKSFRTQVERELNKLERRGATSRRKARTRARQTRNRLQREVKQRRRRFQTTVKQNRSQVEKGLKQAQSTVQERVSTLV
jgi:prefoldin subunit 5